MRKTILTTGGGQGIGSATAYLAARKAIMFAANYNQNHTAATYVVKEFREKADRLQLFRLTFRRRTKL